MTKSESFIRSRLKTRQIALLVHLDKHRSVLKAAEAVAMTQPAASKLLREFEEALDVKLFDRHSRGIAPTWFGEILVRHARSILSEISLAQEEIAALKDGLSGQVSIGTVLSPGTSLVPMAIDLVKRQRPGLLVNVELDYSKHLVKKLLQGDLDMVIGRIMGPEGAEELAFEPMADEQHAVVARARHPLANKRSLSLADVVEQGWILPEPGSVARDRLIEVFSEQGLALPTNVVQTTSLPVITSLLRMTDMVAAIPFAAVQPCCEAGLLTVLIDNLGVSIGPFGIVTRRNRSVSPGAQALLAAVREVASSLYSRNGARPALRRSSSA
jgi:DNA-binding transcriptional LysR family regulator